MAFVSLFYSFPLAANPGGGGGIGEEDEEPAAPIDNWLFLLIFAGVAIGLYYILHYRRKEVSV